ncbi:MAG: hypothetical protein MJY99_04710 [Fibrobacter sp.]|nr:hypothetical protein [Fibrobacter sp.]
MFLNKKGVSIVAVLLFMMVATIAGTAAFKWLTSEGRSSASRMAQQSAYSAAMAGIDNARAWMTNNGHDVGGLVRQYFEGGKNPILLDNVLSQGDVGRNYHVWLTGVDASSARYKMKILSKGWKAQDSTSSYRAVAILEVSGLYRVALPVQQARVRALPFNYTYFGGTMKNHGTANLTSVLINGNWEGNPNHVGENFIVTGNAQLSGNDIDIGGTACIGGNLNVDNGMDVTDIYVYGETKNFGMKTRGVSNNAFFDGPVTQGNKGGVRIGGNLTSTNIINTHQGAGSYYFTVEGNMCLEDTAQVRIGAAQTNGAATGNAQFAVPFTVKGDVWIPIHNSFFNVSSKNNSTLEDFSSVYNMILLGDNSNSKLYIADGHPYADYKNMRDAKSFIETNGMNKTNTTGEKWTGEKYSPYVYVPQKDDMYYFYYVEPGITDVDFVKTADNLARYYVGGQPIRNNMRNETNEYHYGSGVPYKKSPYCKLGNEQRPECHVAPWFQSKGTLSNNMSESNKPECAKAVKDVCDATWEKRPGCDGSKFFVPDMIKTAYDVFKDYANKGCAANITKWGGNVARQLNDCYSKMLESEDSRKNNLYNGYLVVNITSFEDSGDETYLNGRFIVIISGSPTTMKLPPTLDEEEQKGYVFMYVKERMLQNAQIMPAKDQAGVNYNYFIYTLSNLGGGAENPNYDPVRCQAECWVPAWNSYDYNCQQKYCRKSTGDQKVMFNNATLHGSFYAVAEKCAKIPDLMLKSSVSNEEMVADMTDNLIICPIDQQHCGGIRDPGDGNNGGNNGGNGGNGGNAGGAGGAGGNAGGNNGGFDSYYVAMATQLDVSLVSQYEAEERQPQVYDEVTPSYVVLPRIIYITQDPDGTLSDYFSVVNVNGGNVEKEMQNVTCEGNIATTGELRLNNGDFIPEDHYKCEYTPSEGDYGTVPFYLVVNGLKDATADVSFVEDDVEVESGTTKKVSVSLSPVNSGNEAMFDVSVSQPPSGWTITPAANVEVRGGGAGGKTFYKVIAPISQDGTVKDLFTVTLSSDAVAGNLYFQLSSPYSACLPVDPKYARLYKVGDATVVRSDLKTYCNLYKEVCEEKGYDTKKNIPDCNDGGLLSTSVEWVRAQGDECHEQALNESWKCKTSALIKLSSDNTGVPAYCEVIIPTENNSVDNPTSDQTYTLYASVKKKKFPVKVDLDGAQDPKTAVVVKFISGERAGETEKCTAEDAKKDLCVYQVYAGDRLELSHEDKGDDENLFSYWTCSGTNCPDENTYYANISVWSYPIITGDNKIIANFNKHDEHCFYEDFDGMTAFCGPGQTHCIDTCRTVLSKGEICAANDGAQGGAADWLMAFNNAKKGDAHLKPPKFSEEGGIYTENTNNANNQNGTQSVIFSSRDAGPYGEMTAMFNTTILKKANGNDFLNTGLVFRGKIDGSNSEFLILNVFGVGSESSAPLYARVCKVVGHSINNYNSGDCQNTRIFGLTVSPTDMVKISFTLSETDIMSLTAQVGSSKAYATFDLSRYNTNDEFHRHVGFDLSDKALSLYDIGWQSSSYTENCFDVPTVMCSFKANYIGGRVPLDEDVSPWVGVSSWFESNNCTKLYYYNGCDNSTSLEYCSGIMTTKNLELRDSIYHFTERGQHGGATKDAKIKMSCPGTQSSLELSNMLYSCGTFFVGNQDNCSEHVSILSDTKRSSGTTDMVIPVGDDPLHAKRKNFRGAELVIDVEFYTAGDIEVFMVSESGIGSRKESLPAMISESGRHSLNVDVLSNVNGFDPGSVKEIVIRNSGASFDVKYIATQCPYVLGIECGMPKFNQSSGKWEFSTQLSGVASATCDATSALGDKTGVKCSSYQNWSFGYEGKTTQELLDKMNSEGLEPVKFKVEASVNGNTAECEVTSNNIEPMKDIECSVAGESVTQGSGVPSFKFKIDSGTCPETGCPYTVTFGGVEVLNASARSGEEQTVSAPNNSSGNALSVGSYTYKVESYGKSCSRSVKVVKPEGQAPTGVTCNVDNSGSLTANITNPDNVTYSYAFAVHDGIGNSLSTPQTGTSNATSLTFTEAPPNAAGTYKYVLSIQYNGSKQECAPAYTVSNPISATCPSSTIEVDEGSSVPASVTTAGCESGCTYKVLTSGGLEKTSGSISNNQASFSFSDVNASGENTYTFKATRTSDSKTAECPIKVDFISTTGDCHCTCSSGCSHVITSGWNSGNTSGCYFTKTGDFVGPYAGSKVSINGRDFVDTHVGWSDVANVPKVDGGWYIQFKDFRSGANADFDGGTPNCAGGSDPTPESSASVASSSAAAGCHCSDYCSTGCGSLQTNGGNGGGGSVSNAFCLFTTKVLTINENNDKYPIYVNGIRTYYCDGESSCATSIRNHNVPKVDGGYYIQVPQAGEWIKVTGTSGTQPDCSAGIGGGSDESSSNSGSGSASGTGGNAQKIDNWSNGVTLNPGVYDVSQCNNSGSGARQMQIYSTVSNCWSLVSTASGTGYWNNRSGNCDGQATVTFPTRVTVPEGTTVNLRGCW